MTYKTTIQQSSVEVKVFFIVDTMEALSQDVLNIKYHKQGDYIFKKS